MKNTARQNVPVGLGVTVVQDTVYFFYISTKKASNVLRIATSEDGFLFSQEKKAGYIEKGISTKEDLSKCNNFQVSKQLRHFLLLYNNKNKKTFSIEKAWSKDLRVWSYEGSMSGLTSLGALVSDYMYHGKQVMYSVGNEIMISFSNDLIVWHEEKTDCSIQDRFPKLQESDMLLALRTEKGILVLYGIKTKESYFVYVALFDARNPSKLLWHPKEPVWESPEEWNKQLVSLIGVVLLRGAIIGYWQIPEGIYAAIYLLYKTDTHHVHTAKDVSLQLQRHKKNPIIVPKSNNSWEAFNTFNPAAIYDDGKVHLLYRAQGYDYVSVIGYATSKDGIHIDERFDTPIYTPLQQFETLKDGQHVSHFYVSGGGYGGCEDPRITKIDDRYYLTYVAFDGVSPPRIALTSIAADDFLHRRFLWERPVLISPSGVVDKSAVVFPEKIRGKYVIMHRIYPDILIDFVDSLQFDGTTWLEGKYKISPRANGWDSRKIGAGAPPIKTKYGWLLIYQSVGEYDSGRYKIGAMLLDLKDPTKVLYRCQSPILEPEAMYENNGFKAGVIYPCGAVVIGDTLYVYYGGSDSFVCVATTHLETFLQELRFSEVVRPALPVFKRNIFA